ncbi:MAG: hypothetical protein WDN01_14015 [Rhizomicrobium sp.]
MFARATLALAVIAVLLPHEPDLGFGHPGAVPGLDQSGAVQACRALGGSESDCRSTMAQAAVGSGAGDLQSLVFDKLRTVKADLESSRRSSVLASKSMGDGPAVPPSSSR